MKEGCLILGIHTGGRFDQKSKRNKLFRMGDSSQRSLQGSPWPDAPRLSC